MIWYNTYQTLVHEERIYSNNSGMHYTIIIQLKNVYYPHMLAVSTPIQVLWSMCMRHRSLQVDKLWRKINIAYLIEDTEKSQFLKSVVVYIGSKIFYSTINYNSQEPNFELQIVKWSADFLCTSRAIYLVQIYGKRPFISLPCLHEIEIKIGSIKIPFL